MGETDRTKQRLELFERAAAERLLRKEVAQLERLLKHNGRRQESLRVAVESFYGNHARFVASVLFVPLDVAMKYGRQRVKGLVDSLDARAENDWFEWVQQSGLEALLTMCRRETWLDALRTKVS